MKWKMFWFQNHLETKEWVETVVHVEAYVCQYGWIDAALWLKAEEWIMEYIFELWRDMQGSF